MSADLIAHVKPLYDGIHKKCSRRRPIIHVHVIHVRRTRVLARGRPADMSVVRTSMIAPRQSDRPVALGSLDHRPAAFPRHLAPGPRPQPQTPVAPGPPSSVCWLRPLKLPSTWATGRLSNGIKNRPRPTGLLAVRIAGRTLSAWPWSACGGCHQWMRR